MAKVSFSGFDQVENQLESLGRDAVRRIVEAGAAALVTATQESIGSHHHVATGSMARSVKAGKYHEELNSGWIEVYPQGEDSRGISQAKKAFVINYGYGGRKTQKTGDKFITGGKDKKQREQAAEAAMLAESERIINELNGG